MRLAPSRSLAGLAALGLLAACGSETPTAPPPLANDGPDIVLIVIDTLRADHLGIYGHHRPTSPNIDALARGGTWFRRAYAQSGWTLPSMTSLLTGQLPHQHRVCRDAVQTDRFGSLPEAETTLAECLTSAGYRCGAVVNNTFLAPGFGLNQGFDWYDYQGATNEQIRSADQSVDLALEWLGQDGGAPSFLMLHMMEPHLNYDPDASVRGTFTGNAPAPVTLPFTNEIDALQTGQKTLTREQIDYVTALYDEEILAADRAVGKLVDGLHGLGRFEDTVIIVTSDHGEEFWDHGSFEHGHTLYGELTRIPLIARGPELSFGEITTLVQHLDLFQALIEIGSAKAPPKSGGTDVFRLARSVTETQRLVISENVLTGLPRTSITDGRHRVHVMLHNGDTELWKLDENGIEREQLRGASVHKTRSGLRKRLQQLRGNLSPAPAASALSIPDFETFEQLRSLGYIR